MHSKSFEKLSTFIVVISPLFLQYIFILDFILFPEFFLFLSLVFLFFKSPAINFKVFGWMFFYLLCVFFLVCFAIVNYDFINIKLAMTTYIRFFFYICILVFVSQKFFDVKFGAYCLVWIAFLNSAYGLLQYFSYKFVGIALPWYFPFLTVHYGTELIVEQIYYFDTFGYRFSGLFSEPAHFSQYVCFALFFLFFYKDLPISNRTIKIMSVVNLLALLLSASGTGFVDVIYVLLVGVIFFFKNSGRNPTIYIYALFVLFLAFFLVFIQSEDLLKGFSRINSESEYSSLYIRVYRPFEVYWDLDVFYKMFGVGYGNYAEFLSANGVLNDYELSRNVIWTNSAVFILSGVGFFAFCVYLIFHVALYVNVNFLNRAIIIFVLLHLIYSDLPLSLFYVMMMSFVVSPFRQKNLR